VHAFPEGLPRLGGAARGRIGVGHDSTLVRFGF
jgi:hypothetical protein